MRKPELVRAIFAELRSTLTPDVSDGDALRLAHLIVRSYTEERDLLADFGRAKASRSLFYLPVDEAMNDGGWRIMEYERSGAGESLEPDPSANRILISHVERYLGPEWRHHQWIGPL